MKRRLVAVALLPAALAAAIPATAAAKDHAKAKPKLAIQVLSNRADLISARDVLVAVKVPRRARHVVVRAGRRNVSRVFKRRADGRYEGLITKLPLGRVVLKATARHARSAKLAIVDHPNGGPVLAGPQVKPWVCEAGARDAHCNKPTTYSYRYISTSGRLGSYDAKSPPSDVATTRTQTGKRVPFILRTETGYQDRDQYEITVLYQPGKPWKAWAPQKQFNHKLLIAHGASCGIDHTSGQAPSTTGDTAALPNVPSALVGSSPLKALGLGFVVMSTALDNAGHNCNHVVMAESLIMAKERVVERYGTLRYTIGTGCSGGSLAQQEVANAYPGIYQGILPQCSFPDNWSTGQQLADYHLDRLYLEHPDKWAPGVVWTPDSIHAVEGHPNHNNAVVLDTIYFSVLGIPSNPCAGVTDAQRWSPTHTGGVRCTLADYMVNVFGRRRQDGYAGRPLDNVGVQYGLKALKAGTITPAQFVDLNVKIGGADINGRPTKGRIAADEPALRNAYRSGAINETNNLKDVAIIDLRGSDDGTFHDAYRAFAVRARLDRVNGTHANQVIWQGPVPLIGGTDFAVRGLVAMDRWLSRVARDRHHRSLAARIRADRPADVRDTCYAASGVGTPGTDCPAIVRVYQTPRIVAGESVATDQNKCRLRPLRRGDYPPAMTTAEFDQLKTVFPGGVCDWSKEGVAQQHTVPWLAYQTRRGKVVTGGRRLGRPAAGSGGGWASSAFRDKAEAIPGS